MNVQLRTCPSPLLQITWAGLAQLSELPGLQSLNCGKMTPWGRGRGTSNSVAACSIAAQPAAETHPVSSCRPMPLCLPLAAGVRYKAEHAQDEDLPRLIQKLTSLSVGDTSTLSFVDDAMLVSVCVTVCVCRSAWSLLANKYQNRDIAANELLSVLAGRDHQERRGPGVPGLLWLH